MAINETQFTSDRRPREMGRCFAFVKNSSNFHDVSKRFFFYQTKSQLNAQS